MSHKGRDDLRGNSINEVAKGNLNQSDELNTRKASDPYGDDLTKVTRDGLR